MTCVLTQTVFAKTQAPLDYHSDDATITGDDVEPNLIKVYVREVVSAARGKLSAEERASLPCALFLQGGPGFECGRPDADGGWLGEMVKDHRVFLLDQRGTGRSSAEIVRFNEDGSCKVAFKEGASADDVRMGRMLAQCFRADSIVEDAELFRKTLGLGDEQKFTLLGQSFGGFCITTYLSTHPEGVKEALYTGGLPPYVEKEAAAFDAYVKLFERVRAQNEKFYARFPGDVERVRYLCEYARKNEASLPGGGRLSAEIVQALGFSNLGTASGMERLHYILENVDVEPTFAVPLAHKLLIEIENAFRHFETNPLYGILHESIYCNGGNAYGGAEKAKAKLSGTSFDVDAALKTPGQKIYFTGEMVFDFFFDDIPALAPYKGVLDCLKSGETGQFRRLYDTQALSTNVNIPVACASYVEDMFVDFDLAAETASRIAGARVWSTSEYMHSGIREDGARIVSKLLSYVRDEDPIR